MTTITWLFIGEFSPIGDALRAPLYFVVLLINLPAMLLGVAASGNVHRSTDPVFYAAIAVQWALIGLVGSLLWSWLRTRKGTDTEKRDA